MRTYTLTCKFDITRRIEWDEGALETHVDVVVERLREAEPVGEAEASVDVARGRTVLSLTLEIDDDDPRHVAALLLAATIRSCNAGHVGLLSMGEESTLRPGGNQWSGLKTPMWNVREIDFQSLVHDKSEEVGDS